MSIVVGVSKAGRTCMAADSQSSFGASRVPPDNGRATKLQRVGAAILGTTGWGLYENILADFLAQKGTPDLSTQQSIFSFFLELWKALHERYPYVNDQWEQDRSPFANVDASFLVANPSGLFYVASDLSVTPFDRYFAIGSGADFSLGTVYSIYGQEDDTATIARRAVETAIEFNIYCGGEVQLMSLP